MLNVRNDLIKYRGPLRVTPKGLAYISVILSALAEREGNTQRTCQVKQQAHLLEYGTFGAGQA